MWLGATENGRGAVKMENGKWQTADRDYSLAPEGAGKVLL